jgi:hypothetical protein
VITRYVVRKCSLDVAAESRARRLVDHPYDNSRRMSHMVDNRPVGAESSAASTCHVVESSYEAPGSLIGPAAWMRMQAHDHVTRRAASKTVLAVGSQTESGRLRHTDGRAIRSRAPAVRDELGCISRDQRGGSSLKPPQTLRKRPPLMSNGHPKSLTFRRVSPPSSAFARYERPGWRQPAGRTSRQPCGGPLPEHYRVHE